METIIQNFICIGAQKAGTTTLADILSQHPDIYIPEVKETKFFLFDDEYKKGLSFYNASYFNTYAGQKAAGEFDPDYMLFPFTAQRIYDTLGKNLKILVVLRNPADRAYSHYLMSRKKGIEPYSFLQALEEENNRKSDIKTQKVYAYLERGYYAKQLKPFLALFPKQNFLFLLFEEDILRNRKQTIENVQRFLEIPVMDLDTDIHSNEAGEAKNESFRNLVRKPNFAKRILKSIMPSKNIRKNIRQFFIRRNLKIAAVPRLDDTIKKELIVKYFLDDIKETEQLTARSLHTWLT